MLGKRVSFSTLLVVGVSCMLACGGARPPGTDQRVRYRDDWVWVTNEYAAFLSCIEGTKLAEVATEAKASLSVSTGPKAEISVTDSLRNKYSAEPDFVRCDAQYQKAVDQRAKREAPPPVSSSPVARTSGGGSGQCSDA